MIPNDVSLRPGDMLVVRCDEATRFHVNAHVVERVEGLKKMTLSPNELVATNMDALLPLLSFPFCVCCHNQCLFRVSPTTC